ncbi:MAG: valyl-tRNA synthetase [archaeon GW2011_AR5]|nr:MAG: valyl-tRNA synthetase [archaeon GW2011_AR5]
MESKIQEKNWSKEMEQDIFEKWKHNEDYKFHAGKEVFAIDTPPPYVNTPIHIGHAATYTMMDMFARFQRMCGKSVLFPLGLDRNGLPIEVAAEKKFGISFVSTPREKFTEACKKLLEESSASSIDSFLRLGISFNSWKEGTGTGDVYFTDSPEYRALTQATFVDLWEKGLIYEDSRTNNYCPGCRTTIADAEIDYVELPSAFNDIIFTVKETGEKIVIGTTRPELVCTCGMVIFNPEDQRYRHLEGKTAVTPVFEREVPIKSHPYADMEKGTGLMMMCAFGDQTDIRFFREQRIEPRIAINADGRMNENAGFLEGLKVKEAREKIIGELKTRQLLVKQRQMVHRTPICERSKHPIEFISMPEYYLKQVEFKKEMRRIAEESGFFAPHSRQILLDWIESVSIDWPISRRRYYATEIPLWKCESCGEIILGEKGRYVQPWKEQKKCKCGSTARGEERVFDTWFDSANSPLYVMKWGSDFYAKHSPCTLRPQGKEIVRTWLYYTLLKVHLLTGKPAFRDIWIHYHIVDDHGKKMSKSVGNVIDPHEILQRFGAEPFRLWCAVEGNLTEGDMKCSFQRIEGAGKTLSKLWNVAKFVSMFPHVNKPERLQPLDEWIINEMNSLIDYSRKCYESYDFHNPAVRIRNFLWETFASHYLELVKNRAYNEHEKFAKSEQASALFALHYCLENMLKLLAPILPFVTAKLYKELAEKDIHGERFPQPLGVPVAQFTKEELMDMNSAIWKHKKDKGLSLKAEVEELTMDEKFRIIEKDIMLTHSVKKISYGNLEIR